MVVIVDRDGENFFRVVLANDVVVEILAKFGGSGDAFLERLAGVIETAAAVAAGQFLAQNGGADVDAFVTNIDARSGNQLFDLRVAFATEGTHSEI